MAVGTAALGNGQDVLAIGTLASASGTSSSAVGLNAVASADNAIAFGTGATASGIGSTAIGRAATATGSTATALGDAASATHLNASAIGAGATTSRNNQVVVGAATNTYTLAGVSSAASRAAQTGPVLFTTTDASGNLATSNFGPGDIATLDGRVTALEDVTTSLRRDVDKAYEGTAIALAMAGAVLPADKNFAVSINWGTFEGENGFAGTAAARINDNLSINAGLGVGASEGTVGGRAGLTYAW